MQRQLSEQILFKALTKLKIQKEWSIYIFVRFVCEIVKRRVSL